MHQRLRQPQPLQHAPRKTADAAIGRAVQIELRQHALGARTRFPAPQSRQPGARFDPLAGGQKRIGSGRLRQIADAAPRFGGSNIPAQQAYASPCRGYEAQQDLNRRGFAGAVGAEEAKNGAGRDGQGDAVERDDPSAGRPPVREADAQVRNLNGR